MELYKTFSIEPLTNTDLNSSNNQLLGYARENRDYILGDNAEGTGVTPHDHEGSYGKQLSGDAFADNAITTAKIYSEAVTTAKLHNDAVTTGKISDANVTMAKLELIVQRYILSDRLRNAELVYQTEGLVTVSFPWTEPGGTPWANVANLNIELNVANGGHVKDGTAPDHPEVWYYLYIKNDFTIAQPVSGDFLFTNFVGGETGYTLLGSVFNDDYYGGPGIKDFDQQGGMVIWRQAFNVLLEGSSTSWADLDGRLLMPDNARIAKLSGQAWGSKADTTTIECYLYITKKGYIPAEDTPQMLIHGKQTGVASNNQSCLDCATRDITVDSYQEIQYKVAGSSGATLSASIWIYGYYVR